MSWFGAVYFGQYTVDAAATVPAPPPVVIVIEPVVVPTEGPPTGAGRWVRLPPTYVPIGIEYEPVIATAKIVVETTIDVTAEGLVTGTAVVVSSLHMPKPIVFATGHGRACARVIGDAHVALTPVHMHALATATISMIACVADIAVGPCMEQVGMDMCATWTDMHIHLERARQRMEDEALIFDFHDE